MKKIEECLDLVLRELVNNNDLLSFYEVENEQDFIDGIKHISKAYENLFNDLSLTNDEFTQLLNILKRKEYIDYEVENFSGGVINFKMMSKNITGTMTYVGIISVNDESFNKPTNIRLNLTGKFFIQTEGGFTGKLKKEKKVALIQNMALWITATGTGIGGIYLLSKAILWLYDHFFML